MSAILHNLSTEDDFIAGLNVSSLNKSLDKYASNNRPAVCLPTTGEHGLTGVLPLLGFDEAYDRFLFRQFDRSDRSDGGAEGVVDGVISSFSNIAIEGGVSPTADGNDIKAKNDEREGRGVEGGVDEGKGGGEGGGSSDEDDEDWLDSQIG
ncbi:hypothetical protein TrCOL_g1241 [Triparma columacea]|uniref:Uncharacterized protein n=1 Tax=Triparma columacea TaxID=722753 RepID=A0A9W7FXV5_9STRA|nr:hypothetical protein TrCOL_g1241 [Triparma columacea]